MVRSLLRVVSVLPVFALEAGGVVAMAWGSGELWGRGATGIVIGAGLLLKAFEVDESGRQK
jgi:hypothetical protein